MVNKSGMSGNPCFLPYLDGKAFSFSPMSMILSLCLSYVAFTMLRCITVTFSLFSAFIINICELLKPYFFIYWDDYTTFILHFVNVVYHTDDLLILKHPCSPGMNLIWTFCIFFLMCFLIHSVTFCWVSLGLLRILAHKLISLCVCVVHIYSCVSIILALKKYLKGFHALKYLEEFERTDIKSSLNVL